MNGRIVEIGESGHSEPAAFDWPESDEGHEALSDGSLPVVVIDGSNIVIEFDDGDRVSVRVDKTPDELATMTFSDIAALVEAAFTEQRPDRSHGKHPAVGAAITMVS